MNNNNDLNHSPECHQEGCFCKRCQVNFEDKERQKCVEIHKTNSSNFRKTVVDIASLILRATIEGYLNSQHQSYNAQINELRQNQWDQWNYNALIELNKMKLFEKQMKERASKYTNQ